MMKRIIEQQYQQYASKSRVSDDQLAERIMESLPRHQPLWLRLLQQIGSPAVACYMLWLVAGVVCAIVCSYIHSHPSTQILVGGLASICATITLAITETLRTE